MVNVVLVLLCAGAGAVARFAFDGVVQDRVSSEFPFGTLLVNLSGSFVLGLLVGLRASNETLLLAGTATVGSYTTFSTWMLESHRPAEDGEPRIAWLNVAGSLVAGFACALAGRALGVAL